MKVFYGLTNYSQFKRLPEGINVTISARWLMKSQSAQKSLYKYRAKFQDVMLDSGAFGAYFYDKGYTYTPEDYLKLVDEVNPDLVEIVFGRGFCGVMGRKAIHLPLGVEQRPFTKSVFFQRTASTLKGETR